jgi:hypothetical protein
VSTKRGANGWLFWGIIKPGRLPFRVEKLIAGQWRAMAWIGTRELAERLIANGLGGECRVVDVGEDAYRVEWRDVA